MSETLPFSDGVTREVLGIDQYLDRLSPDSDAGRRRAKSPCFFGPPDLEERTKTVSRRSKLDDWCETHADRCSDLRRALRQIPSLHGVTSSLRENTALDDGLLFELKQFLVYADRAVDAGETIAEEWELDPEGVTTRLRHLQKTIHPGGVDDPEFHLSDDHDTRLAEARRRREQMRQRRNERRSTLETELCGEYGGSFGFDGTYRPPNDLDADSLAQESRLRQTGTGTAPAWRLNDDELDDLEEKLTNLERECHQIASRVRRTLSEKISDQTDWLARLQEKLARIDVALAACRLRHELDGCWGTPTAAEQTTDRSVHTVISGGREPSMAETAGDSIQPIDAKLRGPTTIVTGPNMGGKSKMLVLLGLCQWAAQHALPVPAESFEFQPLYHLTYVGSEQPQSAQDFQNSGLSAFAREIRRVVRWMNAPAPSGWLLDEIGRGTHPGDGAELLVDLLAHLADASHRTVATSHFPMLATLDGVQHLQIRGLAPKTDLNDIFSETGDIETALREVMDHQPVDVATGHVPRDARRVASALGLQVNGSLFSSQSSTDMTDSETLSFDSKPAARDWVWSELREQGAARFPFPIRERIPNFNGAEQAAERLFESSVLDEAETMKVNPDSPQKHIRRIALHHGVTVFVPTPRLKGGFMRFDPANIDEENYEDASMLSRWEPFKEEIALEEMPQLDAIIAGCVAVTRAGKRCGKGEGYSDLEYAILRELGHDPVPVYTTVHPLQILDDFPTEPHDLTLDGIATPDGWIEISEPPAGPDCIDWSQLSDEELEEMPILKQLKTD